MSPDRQQPRAGPGAGAAESCASKSDSVRCMKALVAKMSRAVPQARAAVARGGGRAATLQRGSTRLVARAQARAAAQPQAPAQAQTKRVGWVDLTGRPPTSQTPRQVPGSAAGGAPGTGAAGLPAAVFHTT